MIVSSTYFVDCTDPIKPTLALNIQGDGMQRLDRDVSIRPFVGNVLVIKPHDIIRWLEMHTRSVAEDRYEATFGHIVNGGVFHPINTYAGMLSELSDDRREIGLSLAIQEVEQIDDRDHMFLITFYTTQD